jgi:hypothetical protein
MQPEPSRGGSGLTPSQRGITSFVKGWHSDGLVLLGSVGFL